MGAGTEDRTVAFTRALATLKRTGSNLLVVGAGSDCAHGQICTNLLGDVVDDRRRTFISTQRGGCVPAEFRPTDATEISYETATRSAAATATSEQPGPTGGTVRDLTSLGEFVDDAIDDADAATGGLVASQFRLCLDSLRPLLEEHSEKELFRFLHAVTNDVRAARGMGHYHLPFDYDATVVRTFSPLFDAVIEVRESGGETQQRWHLTESDVETDWLAL